MGVVLWEVLANKHLFLGPSEVATMHRVLNEPVPDLYTLAPGIPKRLAELVARSLDRDPARRFATALEMAEAIEAATRGIMPLPQPREVAAVVDTLVGQRIADRKEAITRWLAGSQGQAGSTGTWASLPPALAAQMLTPASGRLPLPAHPPGTPPPRPLPPPAPVRSLSTGSSLSPLLAASSTTHPPPPLSALAPEAPAPVAPAAPRRGLLLLAPGLLLVGLGLGWALTRGAASAPDAPAAPPSAATSAEPPAPSASAPPQPDPPPPESAVPPPSASAPAPAATPAPKPKPTRTTSSPPPVSTGLDNNPYR
jgi:serine/threonine-protein kinase